MSWGKPTHCPECGGTGIEENGRGVFYCVDCDTCEECCTELGDHSPSCGVSQRESDERFLIAVESRLPEGHSWHVCSCANPDHRDEASPEFTKDEGICRDEFSWSQCDSCGTRLGGARECAVLFNNETRECTEATVCTDCVLFHANGDMPESWGE